MNSQTQPQAPKTTDQNAPIGQGDAIKILIEKVG